MATLSLPPANTSASSADKDKHGKQKKATANPAPVQQCPKCGNLPLSECSIETGRLDREAYTRGQQFPGKESSGSRGRGGRGGGFGRGGRGRGRGGGGESGGRNDRAATFTTSPPQQESGAELCPICVSIGHKGRYAMHSPNFCPSKARYDDAFQDKAELNRMVQRLALRVAQHETSGGPAARTPHTTAPPQRQHAPPQAPPPPVSEYRFPPQHNVPPWQVGAGSMGAAGSFQPPPSSGQRQAHFSPCGYQEVNSKYNPSYNPFAPAAPAAPQMSWSSPPWQPTQGGTPDGSGNSSAQVSSSSAHNDRRSQSSDGPTAQSASVTRAIDPATFQRIYRQNGNLFTSQAGQQYVMFGGEFPTEEGEPSRADNSRRVAHTATVAPAQVSSDCSADEMSNLSADARQALPVSAFYSAQLWIDRKSVV